MVSLLSVPSCCLTGSGEGYERYRGGKGVACACACARVRWAVLALRCPPSFLYFPFAPMMIKQLCCVRVCWWLRVEGGGRREERRSHPPPPLVLLTLASGKGRRLDTAFLSIFPSTLSFSGQH